MEYVKSTDANKCHVYKDVMNEEGLRVYVSSTCQYLKWTIRWGWQILLTEDELVYIYIYALKVSLVFYPIQKTEMFHTIEIMGKYIVKENPYIMYLEHSNYILRNSQFDPQFNKPGKWIFSISSFHILDMPVTCRLPLTPVTPPHRRYESHSRRNDVESSHWDPWYWSQSSVSCQSSVRPQMLVKL